MTLTIIPAAGESRRFKEMGINTPKPFLKFRRDAAKPRKMMVEHVIDTLRLVSGPIHVVTHRDHFEKYVLPDSEVANDTRVKFTLVTEGTHGQAHTVLHGLRGVTNREDILVVNVDNAFNYPLEVFLEQAKGTGVPAAALVFPSREASYSYIDSFPLFLGAEEKQPISPWAMAGAYYFKTAGIYRAAYEKQVRAKRALNGEFYISGLFEFVEKLPCLAIAISRENVTGFGTPEELKNASA